LIEIKLKVGDDLDYEPLFTAFDNLRKFLEDARVSGEETWSAQ